MATITKRDTDGVRGLLPKAEFGYDDYPAGGDAGRVYIGTGTEDIPLAKKAEVDAIVNDGTILRDADVGVQVQAYYANNALTTDVTFETLNANGDVGTNADQVAAGDHNHSGVYEPADATILKDADIGVSVQAYDANTAKLNSDQVWSGSQRGTVYTDSDMTYSLSTGNNFYTVLTANRTLTFSGVVAGQSGNIYVSNPSNYIVSAHAYTYISASDLAKLSTTGIYWVSYFAISTTQVLVTVSSSLTSAGV